MDCEDTAEIWEYARSNEYSIVTFDSDFYDISLINGHPPKIIWIRSGNSTTNAIVELLKQNEQMLVKFLMDENFKDLSCLEVQ